MIAALVIILARAGSKGVRAKNTRSVGERPCIAWTIDYAKQARRVGRIVVSSDDPVALGIARASDVQTITRPPELATDTARIDDAARHAADAFHVAADEPIVILYANVPIRPPRLLDRAVDLLESSGCDSVQSYSPTGKYHPWWMTKIDESGTVTPWEGDVLNHGVYRRQELPPVYVPDGGIIALTRRALRCEIPGVPAGPHAFFGKDRRGIINAQHGVVDIDTPHDFIMADAMLRPSDDPGVGGGVI